MATIIEIQGRDSADWVSEAGIVTDMTSYKKKYKDDRVQPQFMLPEIVQDTWNLKAFDVQHVVHDCYFFEVLFKESEVHDLKNLKSYSDIRIFEHTQVDGVFNRSKIFVLDLSKSDYFEISEPERASESSGWKCSIIFRTNRTIVNKITIPNQNNYLTVDGTPNYSTKDILDYYKDTENVIEAWSDGTDKTIQSVIKTGKQILLYFTPADFSTFIISLRDADTIAINGTSVLEYIHEFIEIAEGLIRVVVKCVTLVTIKNHITFTTHNLAINDGVSTYTYYTDYDTEYTNQAPLLSQFENETGIKSTAKSIAKTAKLFKTFQTGANAFALKKRFELGGTITLDSVAVLENSEVVPEKIGIDLYKVEISCLMSTDEKI